MRNLFAALALGSVLSAVGCNNWPGRRDAVGPRVATTAETPQAARLVTYLNDNANRVQAVQCNRVAMDCRQGSQTIGLDGQLVCQKPRNFRLKAKVVGQPAVDIGSNDQEFWYWISKAEPPYVFHCSYTDLARGGVRMPFPFQPDMIVAALGIAEYDPAKQYEVKVTPQTYELVEPSTSPQGQPIQRVTVFSRVQASGNQPQVIGHVLKDAQGREICTATIYEVQQDRQTRALLPVRVKLTYPAEKVEMTLRLYDVQATSIDQARAERLFNRRDLASLPSFDLARWALDGQGVQQARGVMP
jgi:hypothetical protein